MNSKYPNTNSDLSVFKRVMDWLGLGKRTQLPERWTAALGGLLAVLAVFLASGWALGEENLVVATSMGSSAVLLFSTPCPIPEFRFPRLAFLEGPDD